MAQQILKSGGSVLYVDLESNAKKMAERLQVLGVTVKEAENFIYATPEVKPTPSEVAALLTVAATAELVVIDSTGEALSIEGKDPNADNEVAEWFRRIPSAIAKCGPAVVTLDHVPKSDSGSLWPIGSQRKRAAVSGAAYRQSVGDHPFSKARQGFAELVCAKDREGNYARSQKVAELCYVPGEGFTLQLTPEKKEDSEDDKRAKEILDLLEKMGTVPIGTVTGSGGKMADEKRNIVSKLIATGHVQLTKNGNSKLLTRTRLPYVTEAG